jgi:hypothetical protein
VYLPLSISSLCALIRKRARVDRFDNSFILSKYFSCWNINKQCNCEAVEDEEHLLIKCNKYSFARNIFFSNINNNFFPELSDRNKFIWLHCLHILFSTAVFGIVYMPLSISSLCALILGLID